MRVQCLQIHTGLSVSTNQTNCPSDLQCFSKVEQFSTLLRLWPFNTVSHVVVTSTIKLFSLLLPKCDFAAVMNCNVNIYVFWWTKMTLRKGWSNHKRVKSQPVICHRLRTTALNERPLTFLQNNKVEVFLILGAKSMTGSKQLKLTKIWLKLPSKLTPTFPMLKISEWADCGNELIWQALKGLHLGEGTIVLQSAHNAQVHRTERYFQPV